MKVFYIFGTIALCLINSAYAQDPNGNGYGNVVVDTPQQTNALGNQAIKIITTGGGTVDEATRIVLKAPSSNSGIYGDRFIVIDKPPTIDGNIDTTQIGNLAAGVGNGNLNANRLINIDYYENDPANQNVQTKAHLTTADGENKVQQYLFQMLQYSIDFLSGQQQQ